MLHLLHRKTHRFRGNAHQTDDRHPRSPFGKPASVDVTDARWPDLVRWHSVGATGRLLNFFGRVLERWLRNCRVQGRPLFYSSSPTSLFERGELNVDAAGHAACTKPGRDNVGVLDGN